MISRGVALYSTPKGGGDTASTSKYIGCQWRLNPTRMETTCIHHDDNVICWREKTEGTNELHRIAGSECRLIETGPRKMEDDQNQIPAQHSQHNILCWQNTISNIQLHIGTTTKSITQEEKMRKWNCIGNVFGIMLSTYLPGLLSEGG